MAAVVTGPEREDEGFLKLPEFSKEDGAVQPKRYRVVLYGELKAGHPERRYIYAELEAKDGKVTSEIGYASSMEGIKGLSFEEPDFGPVKVLGIPIHLHRTPARVITPAPATGQHTRETLERLGYGPGQIQTLLAEGVIELAQGERA